jgi:hypothetical protein
MMEYPDTFVGLGCQQIRIFEVKIVCFCSA